MDHTSREHLRKLQNLYEQYKVQKQFAPSPGIKLRQILKVLEKSKVRGHVEFGKKVFEELMSYWGLAYTKEDCAALLKLYSRQGMAKEALQLLRNPPATADGPLGSAEWRFALDAVAREGNKEDLHALWEEMRGKGIAQFTDAYNIYITCLGETKQNEEIWHLYETMLEKGPVPDAETYALLIMQCIDNDNMEKAKEMMAGLLSVSEHIDKINENCRNATLAYQLWEGVTMDAIRGALKSMKDDGLQPTTRTINTLLRTSYNKQTQITPEQLWNLFAEQKIEPDGDSAGYTMKALVRRGDTGGALQIYNDMRRNAEWTETVLNATALLLQALAKAPSPDIETISSILKDILEARKKLSTITLQALLMVYLRAEDYDSWEILCQKYDLARKDSPIPVKFFVDYLTDSETPLHIAWDGYQNLHKVFRDYFTRPDRVALMNCFIGHRRADMASRVFFDMRDTPLEWDNKTCTQILAGIGQLRDIQALELVHTQLKMDIHIDPDVILLSALMNAYNHCGMPNTAHKFWLQICAHPDGPTTGSVSIILDTFGHSSNPNAYKRGQQIWQELKAQGFEFDLRCYATYVELQARHNRFAQAMDVVRGMIADGIRPDEVVIGTLYNTMRQDRKAEVELWAKENVPEVWEKLLERTGVAIKNERVW
ncbi:hypothetical protein SAICODRAFT_10198 [Saitoella complicata NRRL Y-17804]|nr:uncharacterized protein SAICODRAFT_10198 [Saitoella complicata NRRL Y-17804]ODQ50144.1 hypothetical protein SAICODRAFT_10198 [Saitoella complicata NRRL Y-17804]